MTIRGVARVTIGDEVILESFDGPANEQTGEPNAISTRFQVSSVGKRFVAASALLLVERGMLDLHESLGAWLTPMPEAWRGITLHHLLSHTAGLGHWADLPGFDIGNPLGPEALLDHVGRLPLLSEPGARWHYSGPGFVLAARVIGLAAGRPYNDFVTTEIFHRLGMSATSSGVDLCAVSARDGVAGSVALGHRSGSTPGAVAGLEKLAGTGDVWSTAPDLERFTRALHGGELLGEESVAALVSVQAHPGGDAPADDPVTIDGYGYGHFVGRLGELPLWFHPGDNPGYLSWLGWLPDRQAVVVVLSNDEAVPIEAGLRELLSAAGG